MPKWLTLFEKVLLKTYCAFFLRRTWVKTLHPKYSRILFIATAAIFICILIFTPVLIYFIIVLSDFWPICVSVVNLWLRQIWATFIINFNRYYMVWFCSAEAFYYVYFVCRKGWIKDIPYVFLLIQTLTRLLILKLVCSKW